MRRTSRTALVAICFACLLALPLFQSAHQGRPIVSPAAPAGHVTVEPGLPLRIDLKVHEAQPGLGNAARVEAVIDADDDLREVSLTWVFPEGVEQEAAEESSQVVKRLQTGERRVLQAAIRAAKQADLPIRLEASFKVPDGRSFRTQQGILWHRGPKKPEGRHHAGAYEVMGEPLP